MPMSEQLKDALKTSFPEDSDTLIEVFDDSLENSASCRVFDLSNAFFAVPMANLGIDRPLTKVQSDALESYNKEFEKAMFDLLNSKCKCFLKE